MEKSCRPQKEEQNKMNTRHRHLSLFGESFGWRGQNSEGNSFSKPKRKHVLSKGDLSSPVR